MDSQIQVAYMGDVKSWQERNGQLQNGWDREQPPDISYILLPHFMMLYM